MSAEFGLSDIHAITKLACDLYFSLDRVARDAPDGFRQLVNELSSLQAGLRTLCDDVGSNPSQFDEPDEIRKQVLNRCLDRCLNTLLRLKDLMADYRDMGILDGRRFWKKVKWRTQEEQIQELKSRTMVHTCNLSLCMSSIRSSSLEKIEMSMMQALEEENSKRAYASTETHEMEEPSPPLTKVDPGNGFGETAGNGFLDKYRGLGSQHGSINSRRNHVRKLSSSSESVTSGNSDASAYNTSIATTMSQPTKRSVTSPTTSESWRNSLSNSLSPGVRGLEPGQGESRSSYSVERNSDRSRAPSNADGDHTNLASVVVDTMEKLQQIRKQEQLSRPLRIEQPDKLHRPDNGIKKKFEVSISQELKYRRLTTRDWLRVGIWWLLKARAKLVHGEKPNYMRMGSITSTTPSTDSRSANHQAYADLLKSSYILYEVVLGDKSSLATLTDENRKLITDLSEALKEDFAQFNPTDIPDRFLLEAQSLDIWEPLQTEEERLENSGDLFSSFDNSRWVTVEQEDSGGEDEIVLYRAFVNAEIGSKKYRRRTRGAPYLLILCAQKGGSEPKITFCNQSGSLCLQRDFVSSDLNELSRVANANYQAASGSRVFEPALLKFDSMNISISFQYTADLEQFIRIPSYYFHAVRQREPVDSPEYSETVLFKSCVESSEELKSPSMKPLNNPSIYESCEIRILERSFGETWRSIRRMVISTSAADKNPRCVEFFMPLRKVQVKREDSSAEVLVHWSSAAQEKSKLESNIPTPFAHVYEGNTNSTNVALSVHFHSEKKAKEFEKAVLRLGEKSIFSWNQATSSGHVYDIVDTDVDKKQYKAVSLVRNGASDPSWKYCDVYYLNSELDYVCDHPKLRVRFPRVYYTEYISTQVDHMYQPDQAVAFSHSQKQVGDMAVEFETDGALRKFLTALAPTCELLYTRRVQLVAAKRVALWSSAKLPRGRATIQLWKKGNSVKFAVRWLDSTEMDKWLSMALNLGLVSPATNSNKATFARGDYFRGEVLDMENIAAKSATSSKKPNKHAGTITMLFETEKDQEEFVKLCPSRGRYVQRFADWQLGSSG